MKYPAFRKRGEEIQVGDLVRRLSRLTEDPRTGIIMDIEPTGDYLGVARFLVKWLDLSGSQWYIREYLEVLGAAR